MDIGCSEASALCRHRLSPPVLQTKHKVVGGVEVCCISPCTSSEKEDVEHAMRWTPESGALFMLCLPFGIG